MKTDKAWQIWGEKEPYYAVVTDDKYLAENLGDEGVEEFFERGRQHLDDTFMVLHDHVDASFAPARALDFGCGTGRFLVPLAERCETVVGVDVSDGMLREAARNCSARNRLQNWRLLSTQAFRDDPSIRYDFLHSHIVFQHIRRKEGEPLLELLLERLEPGGGIAVQFMYRNTAPPIRRCLTWMKNRLPFAPLATRILTGKHHLVAPMEMNVYDVARIKAIIAEAGVSNLYLRASQQGVVHSLTIYGRKSANRC
ncbi:MAG: class I SAM-dependent methyltransferase [Gammaproteobacteria bacterium]|nr:MAG: class I SAM-dependent methyltransferase [Gammaproteobacteria bacterium]